MSSGSRKEKAKNIIEDKEYRDFYTETFLKKSIPFQMRTMRTERGWSQTLAGEILGKGQNAISRLESPAYGKLTLQTLLEIAKGFDVGLVVKFVPYSKLLKEYEDVSFDALSAPSPTKKFKDEIEAIWRWAGETKDVGFWEAKSRTNILTSDKFAPKPVINTFTLPSKAIISTLHKQNRQDVDIKTEFSGQSKNTTAEFSKAA